MISARRDEGTARRLPPSPWMVGSGVRVSGGIGVVLEDAAHLKLVHPARGAAGQQPAELDCPGPFELDDVPERERLALEAGGPRVADPFVAPEGVLDRGGSRELPRQDPRV